MRWILLSLSLGALQQPGLRFTLDGRPIRPCRVPLEGTPDDARAGDVIEVEGFHLVVPALGAQATLALRRDPDDPNVLWRMTDRGPQPAVLRVADHGRGAGSRPGAAPSPEVIPALLGIVIEDWRPGLDALLASLHPDAVVTVSRRALPQALAALPRTTRCLRIDDYVELEEWRDGLARFPELRYLATGHALGNRDTLDAACFAACPGLRHLELRGIRLAHPHRLAALTRLRSLAIAWCRDVTDLGPVAMLPALLRLELRSVDVSDLAPLGGLASLVELAVEGAPVARLPAVPLAALRRFRVLGHRLSADAVAEFARRHPHCAITWRHDDLLRERIQGSDTVRVYAGGSQRPRGRLLATVTAAAEVMALLQLLRVDESRTGFHCMCSGSLTLEFEAGAQQLAALSLHHGASLRWSEWPGDAGLQPASARGLCGWLAARGIPGPLAELDHAEAQRAAAAERARLRAAIAPQIYAALDAAESGHVAQTLAEALPDRRSRLRLALALLAAGDTSWDVSDWLDQELHDRVLGVPDAEEVRALLAVAAEDPAVAAGAARWLFTQRSPAAAQALDDRAFAAVAHAGLGHPHADNRKQTIAALAEIGGERALQPLRQVLAGVLRPRPASQPAADPPGMVRVHPASRTAARAVSERVLAAVALGRHRDQRSADAIAALRATATGRELELLDEALAALATK